MKISIKNRIQYLSELIEEIQKMKGDSKALEKKLKELKTKVTI